MMKHSYVLFRSGVDITRVVLRETQRAGLSLLVVLFCTVAAFAQDRTVTGTVRTSEDNSALPGVSVQVVGTTRGTQTDANGTYRLSVASGDVLRFSFIGLVAKDVTVGAQSVIDVTLDPDAQALSEVVVVGYGVQRKADVTGATATVTAKDFNAGVLNNPISAVQGKVAGLVISAPNSDPANGRPVIRLRGTSSLSANAEPLIVIDGVAGAALNSVAPEDIQSVDVLKDASSAAIYGSRGANGVIIITTKKGTAGRTTVDYSGFVSVENEVRRPPFLTPDEYAAKLQETGNTSLDFGARTNWFDEITRTALAQNHAVGVSGGTDKFSYRGSVVYLDQPGVAINSGFNRLNTRLNLTQKALNDKLEIQILLSHQTNNKNFTDYSAFRSAMRVNPTRPIYNPDGTFFQAFNLFENDNPVARLTQIVNEGREKQTLVNAKAFYELLPGLRVGVNGSMSEYTESRGFFIPTTFTGFGNVRSSGNRSAREVIDRLIETTISYNKVFGKSRLDLLAGHTYQKLSNEGFRAENANFPDAFQYNNLGAGNENPDGSTNRRVGSFRGESILVGLLGRVNYSFDDKYLITANVRRDGSSRFGANNRWGFFPSVSAGWRIIQEDFMKSVGAVSELKLRVGYGVTGNQDGIGDYAARLLYGPRGAYYTNGGFQTAYFFSQNANPDLKWETSGMLNIGLDFGFVKNRLTGSIEYYDKQTRDLLFNYPIAIGQRYGSQDLTAVADRLFANVGRMSNRGVELQLDYLAIDKTDFQWRTNLALSRNVNRVTSLSNDIFTYNTTNPLLYGGFDSGQGGIAQPIVLQEGYPIGTFFGPRFIGFDEDGQYQYEDINGDGVSQPTGEDRTYLGDSQPKLVLGWTNNFTYKRFDLSFLINGSFGQKIANGPYIYFANPNRFPGENVVREAFTTGIGQGVQPQWSDLWLEDGSFLRLNNFRLAYNIPAIGNIVQRAQVYVAGQNVFLLTRYRGADPEVRTGAPADVYGTTGNVDVDNNRVAQNLSPGVDPVTYYPRTRSFILGVSFTF
jgi:TonB-linked SusC/RagA family outer membrane protein